MSIKDNVKSIISSLPANVKLVAAVKTRSTKEVYEALEVGLKSIGHNYVQEAEAMYVDFYGSLDAAKSGLYSQLPWHCIGHLQKNKVKKAVKIFDIIETVDSLSLAKEISKRASAINKTIEILIEVNSAREEQKNGVMPEETLELIKKIKDLPNIKIKGLMTMGAFLSNPESIRPYFKVTKKLFDSIAQENIENVSMQVLSMGMSDSYRVAIEEGANVVRIGTKLFGLRNYKK